MSSLTTTVKVKVISTKNNQGNPGVVVTIGNPQNSYNYSTPGQNPGASVQSSQTTDTQGVVLFTGLTAGVYNIGVSGVGVSYQVNNSYMINPDNIPYENRTVMTSYLSGTNVIAANKIITTSTGGTVSGTRMAPNVVTDFSWEGGVVVASHVPTFYNQYTNTIVLWSGTNVGTQQDNRYFYNTEGPQAFQQTTIYMNI